MAKRKPVRNYHPGEATLSQGKGLPARGSASAKGGSGGQPASNSGWRGALERRSGPALLWMGQLPTFVVPATLLVLVMIGLLVPAAWAGALLLFVGLFLTWLTMLSWPATSNASRALRVVVNLLVVAIAIAKMAGRF
jgi:hypothetical protein